MNNNAVYLYYTCLHLHLQVINTSTFATVSLEGHTAPVLSVDLDKSGNTVVSSSCDGSVRIWSVETKKQVRGSADVKLSEQTSLDEPSPKSELHTFDKTLGTRDSSLTISTGPDSRWLPSHL